MHVDLRVEAVVGDALHGFIHAPVASADHHFDAVDDDGQVLGVGHLILHFAYAEVEGLLVGTGRGSLKAHRHFVEVGIAVSVGPPQLGIQDVQRGRRCRVERNNVLRVRPERHFLDKADIAAVAGDGANELAGDAACGAIFEAGGEGKVGAAVVRREHAGDLRILEHNRAGGRERDWEPDAGVTVPHCGDPVPADGGKEGGAIDGGYATVVACAQVYGVLVGDAGVRLRTDEDGKGGTRARLDDVGKVEVAAEKGAAQATDLPAIDPDIGRVIDTAEVQPGAAATVRCGNGEGGAVPVARLVEALRDGAHVFAIERLRVHLVVDERGEHGSGYGRLVPSGRCVARAGDGACGRAYFGDILHLPAVDYD